VNADFVFLARKPKVTPYPCLLVHADERAAGLARGFGGEGHEMAFGGASEGGGGVGTAAEDVVEGKNDAAITAAVVAARVGKIADLDKLLGLAEHADADMVGKLVEGDLSVRAEKFHTAEAVTGEAHHDEGGADAVCKGQLCQLMIDDVVVAGVYTAAVRACPKSFRKPCLRDGCLGDGVEGKALGGTATLVPAVNVIDLRAVRAGIGVRTVKAPFRRTLRGFGGDKMRQRTDGGHRIAGGIGKKL